MLKRVARMLQQRHFKKERVRLFTVGTSVKAGYRVFRCHLCPRGQQNGASVLFNVGKSCSQTRWKLIIDSGLRRHINSTQPHRQVRESRETTPAACSQLARAQPPLRTTQAELVGQTSACVASHVAERGRTSAFIFPLCGEGGAVMTYGI